MRKYDKLLNIVKDKSFTVIDEKELKFLTGGANVNGQAGGSQTSNTGGTTATCCDATCVCTCIPPVKAKLSF